MEAPARIQTRDDLAVEAFLRSATLFKGCDASVIARVAPHVEALAFSAGATILRAGVPSEGGPQANLRQGRRCQGQRERRRALRKGFRPDGRSVAPGVHDPDFRHHPTGL